MNPLFSYIDYRLFLKDHYEEQKKNSRFFSYRYFAQKAGINSPNFLKQIIESKRNLTVLTIDKFITALKLNEKEAQFFRHLVLFNQSKSAQEKQVHYAVMLSMMHTVKEQRLTALQHEYYTHWFVPVIREMVNLHHFNGDCKKLAAVVSPPISVREARFAIKLLKKLGFIEPQPDGSFRQTAAAIISDSSVARMAVRSFNREMLRKAEIALDSTPVEERQIYGVTIGISKACYDVLAAEMAAFRDRVVAITSSDKNSSRVYQMHLQLFPLSRDLGADGTAGVE
ncbi:MAG: TIGR02147 family protein, partial [Chitinispirillaceae bacterium]|nr:TIGR02147 family protein [Chitinispirillaceae bacterium]